ncbi:MAG: hypothetical protein ACOCRK_03780 [bacterium]
MDINNTGFQLLNSLRNEEISLNKPHNMTEEELDQAAQREPYISLKTLLIGYEIEYIPALQSIEMVILSGQRIFKISSKFAKTIKRIEIITDNIQNIKTLNEYSHPSGYLLNLKYNISNTFKNSFKCTDISNCRKVYLKDPETLLAIHNAFIKENKIPPKFELYVEDHRYSKIHWDLLAPVEIYRLHIEEIKLHGIKTRTMLLNMKLLKNLNIRYIINLSSCFFNPEVVNEIPYLKGLAVRALQKVKTLNHIEHLATSVYSMYLLENSKKLRSLNTVFNRKSAISLYFAGKYLKNVTFEIPPSSLNNLYKFLIHPPKCLLNGSVELIPRFGPNSESEKIFFINVCLLSKIKIVKPHYKRRILCIRNTNPFIQRKIYSYQDISIHLYKK